MILIGDIHGHFEIPARHATANPDRQIYLLGDVGIGFPGLEYPSCFAPNVKFLRGNHDNPGVCRVHPSYLGDYGVEGHVGWISGAMSIDRAWRTDGVDWWEEEQLTWAQMADALTLFSQVKPRIIISHDAPWSIVGGWWRYEPTRTSQFLDEIAKLVKPDFWYFGHYHDSKQEKIGNTVYRCVDINEVVVHDPV